MRGNSAKDEAERAESEWMVVRDRDTVVSRLGSFQDNVTADLVHPRVLPSAAKDIGKMCPRNVARKLHATNRISSRTR